jgi:outer membrane receptor protein involved in Fe transport
MNTMTFLAALLSISVFQGVVTGVVRDQSGGTVSGATVIVRTAAGVDEQTVTGPDGRFTLVKTPPAGATLIVRAGGFAEKQQPWSMSAAIEVVLAPAALLETVTVTPSRTEERLGNIPASINILDAEEIRHSPAIVADDFLRQIPTFSLFRRTSSLSSHPTAQGVSLRGIGPSGVSRTLVMVDGIPFNDPFGGWVYWTRVPMESVDRVEVVDGSSSSLYGNYAMGGVINVVGSAPSRRTVEMRAQYGNRNSPKLDIFGSDVWGKVGVAVDASLFDTDGFPIVIDSERRPSDVNAGPGVDTKAAVSFRNVNVKLDYSPTSGFNAFVRGGYFTEERDNGKVSTIDGTPEGNDTEWTAVSGGVRMLLPDQSDFQARIFTDFETFRSNFLAVPAPPQAPLPRSVGRMTLNQRVPSKSVGGMAQWSRAFGTRHYFTAGTDFKWVDGDSEEDALDAVRGQTITLQRVSGGTQRSIGAFVQDVFNPVDRLVLTFGARLDAWRNYDAHNLETNVPAGTPAAGHRPALPDTEDTVASPRVAALYRINDRVSAWGDLSWGFRAPTLNELYRQFRVGAILTLANDQLGPERLVAGEAGIRVEPIDNLTIRSTWFDNRVKNPVSNVTRTDLVNTLQRQNLGRTRIAGVQTDIEYRFATVWRVSGGYLYNRATVTEFVANPGIVGNFLPQVPKHRGSFQVLYVNPALVSLGVGVQVLGRQFDDDLNTRVVPGESEPGLPGYTIVDLTASRSLVRNNLEAFFGVQNLFDQQYIVGTLPTTIGSPRLVHGGVRVRWAGR